MNRPAWLERVYRARGVPAPAETATPATAAEPPEPERGRSVCPDCGRDVVVNKDGRLRKHNCVAEDDGDGLDAGLRDGL